MPMGIGLGLSPVFLGGLSDLTLHLNFMLSTSALISDARLVGPNIIFTRASHAQVRNEDGDLQYAPHQLIENSNLSSWTGSDPSGWQALQGGTRVEGLSVLGDGVANATMTATNARPYLDNAMTVAEEEEYTIGCYIEAVNHTGGNTAIMVVVNALGTGIVQGIMNAADFTTPGWYAFGFYPGTGDTSINPRFGIGAGANASGTMTLSHPFFIKSLLPEIDDPRVTASTFTRLSGPPLGRWVGTDDGDEPKFDAMRFDHDKDGVALGFLCEGFPRTNLFTFSQELDDPDWTKTAQVAVTERDAVAPDGTTTACLLTNSGDDATTTQAVTVTAGDQIAVSAWVKDAVAGGHFHIEVTGASGTADAWFDVGNATPVVGTKSATTYTADASYLEDWGNDWWRAEFIVTTDTDTAITCRLIIADGDNSDTEDATDAMHIWGAQCEVIVTTGIELEPARAMSAIPTYAVTFARVADRCRSTVFSVAEQAWINGANGVLTIFTDSTVPAVATGDDLSIIYAKTDGGEAGARPYILVSYDNTFAQHKLGYFPIDLGAGILATTTPVAGVRQKFAAATALDDAVAYLNGANQVTNSTWALIETTIDELYIGHSKDTNIFHGHIHEIKFWRGRKPNAELIALTA